MSTDTQQQSERPASAEPPASTRTSPPAVRRGPGGRGPFGSMGMPAEKSLNFGPSAKRLMRPAWLRSGPA